MPAAKEAHGLETAAGSPLPELDTSKAVRLQRELWERYTLSDIQRNLEALGQRYNKGTAQWRRHLEDLCLGEQAQVLPRYGFEGTKEGVSELNLVLKRLEVDTEVRRWSNRIRRVLGIPERTKEMAERVAHEDRQDGGGTFDWGTLDALELGDVKGHAFLAAGQVCSFPAHRSPATPHPEHTGMMTWPSVEALVQFFVQELPSAFRGRRALELGSGMGLGGLAALALGAELVLLSDVEGMLGTMRQSLELNEWVRHQPGKIDATELDWRKVAEGGEVPAGRFDFIFWADCVHWPELFEPMCLTVERIATDETVLVFAVQMRGRTGVFLERLRRSFNVFEVWRSRAGNGGLAPRRKFMTLSVSQAVSELGESDDLRIYRGKRMSPAN